MNKLIKFESAIDVEISPEFVILCDMDGTLIDTNYANFLSYRRAIQEVAVREREIHFHHENRVNREWLKENIPYLTDEQYDSIVSLKTYYYSEYLPETKLNTVLVGFLRKYSGSKVLVTCCREERAVETLQYHNLLGCFSRLICWEALSGSGLSNKYANALNLLSVNPGSCIVCENDITEIREALVAGVPISNIISIDCHS